MRGARRTHNRRRSEVPPARHACGPTGLTVIFATQILAT